MKIFKTAGFRIVFLVLAVFGLAVVVGQGTKPIAMFPYVEASWGWIFEHEKSFDVRDGTVAILAHDMLSYAEINAMYRGIDQVAEPSVVVVLAPNHYERGRGDIQTTTADFVVQAGLLSVDKDIANEIVKNGWAVNNKPSFVREHGITTQVGFIHHYFPKSKIVPLIFKQGADARLMHQLSRWLATNLPDDALVLASLDFSHYFDKTVADKNDVQTLKTIQNFDYDALPAVDISCPFVDSTSALWTIMRYAELRDQKTVHKIWHDNSADITGDPDMESTTGHLYIEFV